MASITKTKKGVSKGEIVKPAAQAAKPAAKVSAPKAETKPVAKAPKATAKKAAPTYQEIALRAYYIAEDRCRQGRSGCPESDWLQAESAVSAEYSR